jgi:hypothetical protein
MSNPDDILSRQRKKASAYSFASDLLAEGDPPDHVEGRLVNEGLSTVEAREIVSALRAASQSAEDVLQGLDGDGRSIKSSESLDPCRPPTIATLVKCQRCGREYESSRIEERLIGDAEGRPQWCCPNPGCIGTGFGFQILPVNRQYHNEDGDWDPLLAFYPDASRRHQVHYEFAHRFLPKYVHDDPGRFFRPLSLEAPTLFIHMTWNMYLHMAGFIRGNRLRRVSDLTMNLQQLAGRLVALIEMPTPEAPNEAFFVAVVLLADSAPPEPIARNVCARVFTLEAENRETAVAGEGMVGEWAKDGSHFNYGRNPCNREAFLEWVIKQLPGKKAPWWKFWKRSD